MQRNLIATGVCSLRWRDACMRRIRLIRLIKYDDRGARLRPDGLRRGKSCYTPWVCGAQCGWARAMSYRWGNYFSSAPQNKNPVFIVFTVFTVSAARRVQQTVAAMQNLGAKIYRRVMQRAKTCRRVKQRARWLYLSEPAPGYRGFLRGRAS